MDKLLPAQLRAARGLLDWTRDELAARSGTTKRNLARLEGGETEPRPSTIAAIRSALEAAGVEFIPENGGGAGVRLRERKTMAKVWLVMEGADPTKGGPFRELSLESCVEKIGLSPSDFLGVDRPRFGDQKAKLAAFREARHVVVELDSNATLPAGWKPGFYMARITPKEAQQRL